MPDLETRMPDLLRRAAAGLHADDELERRTLRRARRRRARNASAAALTALALVVGLALGARELVVSVRTTPGDEGSTPSPGAATGRALPAIWPEATAERLAEAQARADAGELDWRLDPVETATAFATEVLGWDPSDVGWDLAEWISGGADARVVVRVRNAGLGSGSAPPPETELTLLQLGRTGDGGVWSVTRADSDRIDLQELPQAVSSSSMLEVAATFRDTQDEWSVTLGLLVTDPSGPPSVESMSRDATGRFTEQLALTSYEGTVGVSVMLVDPEGTRVAADIVPLIVEPPSYPTPSLAPTASPADEGLPTPVLQTRDAILAAIEARDFDALEALIDPDRFSYNFSDGHNPVPEWREDPTVLDTLAAILRMPFATREGTPDVGTIYVWPALVDADLTALTDEERAMLAELGISEREVRRMLEAFGAYAGPRTGIAQDGTWLFSTLGGD